MPRCVLGLVCNFPDGEVRAGHRCKVCGHGVHVFCAHVDESQPLASNSTCLLCTGDVTQHQVLTGFEEPLHNQPQTHRHNEEVTKSKKVALPPPTKPSNQQRSSKLKKTNAQKGFTIVGTKTLKETLATHVLLKPVAFDIEDESYGQQLYEHFLSMTKDDQQLQTSLTKLGERTYLLGSVTKESKNQIASVSKKFYYIQWEHDRLGETPVDLDVILGAHELYLHVFKKPVSRKQSNIFERKVRESLAFIDDINKGVDPYDSESDYEVDDNEEAYTVRRRKLEVFAPVGNASSFNETNRSEDGYRWSATGTMFPPSNLSHRRPTHVLQQFTGYFQTPVSSLLSFIPLKLFNAFAFYSNAFAHDKMAAERTDQICGSRWKENITLQEMMVFFGILIKMVLRPTPGQSYTACWDDQAWHPYTSAMTLRRFQQIRSVLHFNDNSKMLGSQDAAFKVSCVCF
jgi:hypothetical protein